MSTIDEQVQEYMRGYYEGTRSAHLPRIHFKAPEGETEPDFRRGYVVGRAAYKTVELAELVQLGGACPICRGHGRHVTEGRPCDLCHGTGRRQ